MKGRETLGLSENENNLPYHVVICAALPVICMGAISHLYGMGGPETVDREAPTSHLYGRRAGILDEMFDKLMIYSCFFGKTKVIFTW